MAIHITSSTKSAKIRLQSRKELRSLIERELKRQGPDADLNHIDVSEITDMTNLFIDLDVRNVKMDKWDVSNVKYMSYMFYGCSSLCSDLSAWNTSNVITTVATFHCCSKMTDDLKPKI